ncbi:MAG: hypothetical protein HY903_17280 [Deltaproteobacteria bacterium]|nr:hypothetical protein [Deltaproteobacteria bacterium]
MAYIETERINLDPGGRVQGARRSVKASKSGIEITQDRWQPVNDRGDNEKRTADSPGGSSFAVPTGAGVA